MLGWDEVCRCCECECEFEFCVLLIGREFSLAFLFERAPFFFREEGTSPLTSPLNMAPSASGDEGGVVSNAPLGSAERRLFCFLCDRFELRDALGVGGCWVDMIVRRGGLKNRQPG